MRTLAVILLLLCGTWFVAGDCALPLNAQGRPPTGAPGMIALTELEPESEIEGLLGSGSALQPCRYMVIKHPLEGKAIQVRILRIDTDAGPEDPGAKRVFGKKLERWGPSNLVRRYNIEEYDKVFKDFRAPAGAKINPVMVYNNMSADFPADRGKEQSVAIADLKILRYPQTWVNIWEFFVLSRPVSERLDRVIEFDQRFLKEIENLDAKSEYFSPVEQAAYARFYQEQFSHKRNQDPHDPSIYHRLAELHGGRGNVDAELSVYLDAIRNEVSEPDIYTFRYKAGEILARRLGLYEEALPHLEAAGTYADTWLLRIECYHKLGKFDKELEVADAFLDTVNEDIAEGTPTLDYGNLAQDAVRDRAILFKARAFLHKGRDHFKVAYDILKQIDHPEKDYLLASMYLYEGRTQEAMQTIEKQGAFAKMLIEARKPKPDISVIPYDPQLCAVLCVWARAKAELAGIKGDMTEMLAALKYAALVDPLSVEPSLVRGCIHEMLGQFPDASEAYVEGLAIDPGEPRLNYAVGSLHQRTSVLDRAQVYYNAALRADPAFYAAMNRLGEIVLDQASVYRAEIDRLNAIHPDTEVQAAEIRSAIGQALVGVANSIREAAAHYSSSIDINPQQSAVRARLAGLYIQLAGLTGDKALGLSYLYNARDLAQQGIADAEAYGSRPRAGRPTPAESASAPPLDAYATFAYASYEIGKREELPGLREEARAALARLRIAGQDPRFFPSSEAMQAFRESGSFTWALETLSALIANDRQVRKRDDFNGRKGGIHSLGNRWLPFPRGVDNGCIEGTSVDNGRLTIGVKEQNDDQRFSRIGLQERFTALASFAVVIPELGTSGVTRGVHLTRLAGDKDAFTGDFDWSLMIGFDADNRLIWDVRGTVEGEAGERSLMIGEKPLVVEPRLYGGNALTPRSRVELRINRFVPSDNGPTVKYEVVINGYTIRLDFAGALDAEICDRIDNANLVQDDDDAVMAVGFFTVGPSGSSGALSVDECEWVLDSNLARRTEEK